MHNAIGEFFFTKLLNQPSISQDKNYVWYSCLVALQLGVSDSAVCVAIKDTIYEDNLGRKSDMMSVQNDTLKTGSAERQTIARYNEVASVVQNQVLSSFCGNFL